MPLLVNKLSNLKSWFFKRVTFAGNSINPKHPVDWTKYNNVLLPAKRLRTCGERFASDEYYLASAQAEADRLIKRFGLSANSRVLDIGCGRGRLAIGILNRLGKINRYLGIDVHKPAITWCQRYITPGNPEYSFLHINTKNLRYNPLGGSISTGFRFPLGKTKFDIIYLYSVFTHMTKDNIRAYLKGFKRLLDVSGKVFLTAFVEENVPEMSINPSGYGNMNWTGPLHCVRYNKTFFESLISETGFRISYFGYRETAYIQSVFHLEKD